MSKSLIAFLIFLALLLPTYFTYRQYSTLKSIDNYDSCLVAKGSMIQESYPATCVTKIGTRFVEPVTVPSPTPIPIPSIPLNWQTYTNSKYHFSFQHPPTLLQDNSPSQFNAPAFVDKKDNLTLRIQAVEYKTGVNKLDSSTWGGIHYNVVNKTTNGISYLKGEYLDDESLVRYDARIIQETDPTIMISLLFYGPRSDREKNAIVFEQILQSFRFTE